MEIPSLERQPLGRSRHNTSLRLSSIQQHGEISNGPLVCVRQPETFQRMPAPDNKAEAPKAVTAFFNFAHMVGKAIGLGRPH